MLFFGACHLLIWSGDIVFFYGLVAFLLLPLRRYSNSTLILSGVILILMPVVLYALKMTWPVLNYPAQALNQIGSQIEAQWLGLKTSEDYEKYYKNAGWLDIIKSSIPGFF